MKFFTRGLVLFVLSLGMLALAGCGVDNEKEGEKLAKEAGDPGAANPKALPATPQPPPATQEEAHKRTLEAQKDYQKKGTSSPPKR